MSIQSSAVDTRTSAIVEAAARLAERAGSIEAVSVDQIAAEAGLAKATLYRRFPTKAAIAAELARRGLAEAQPSDDRRTQILEAAARAFPRAGIRGTTMEQIAAEAGISPATIYWYFSSKEELAAEMLRRMAPTDLAERLTAVPDQAPPDLVLRELARGVIARVGEQPALLRLILAEAPLYPELAEIVYERVTGPIWSRVAAYLARQVELGRFRPGDPMARLFCLAGPLVVSLLARQSFGGRIGVTPEQVVDEAVRNFLCAVAAQPNPEVPP